MRAYKYNLDDTIYKRYRVLAQLGEGLCSEVYRVKHLPSGRVYALKLIRTGSDYKREIERLIIKREIESLKLLSECEHIVGLFDVLEPEEEYEEVYLVLEYIPGDTIEQIIRTAHKERRQPPFPAEAVRQAALDLLKAMKCMHDREEPIVHRDIKPSNLILSRDKGLVVIDFNVSKILTSGTSAMTSWPIGTPGYIPPEVLAGKKWTAQGDIYSAGLVLYQMLTGKSPDLPRNEDKTHINAYDTQDFYPDFEKIEKPVADIVLQSIAYSPEHRFQSAQEMEEAIEIHWSTNKPPPARKSLPDWDKAIMDNSSSSPFQKHIEKAEEFSSKGNYAEALKHLDRAEKFIALGSPEASALNELRQKIKASQAVRPNELLNRIGALLENPEVADAHQEVRDALNELESLIPGDRRLTLLKNKLNERDIRLQEKRIYEETKTELEKIWQEAKARASTTLIPSADIDKAYYKKAADLAEAVANTHPDFILLKELVAIAQRQREDFLENSKVISTLLGIKGIKEAVEHIQRLAPNEAVDLFDLDSHALGKFTRDEALSKMDAIAADFATTKMQEYIGQAERYLAEHDPGAAKGVLERALKLYGLSGNDQAEIKRQLNLDIEPALQARQKAESLIQSALHASNAEAAWKSWKEAQATDRDTPKLEDSKREILKRLNAELLRRLDSVKTLLDSSFPDDWKQAEDLTNAAISLASQEAEALASPLAQGQDLLRQAREYAVTHGNLTALETKLTRLLETNPGDAKIELRAYRDSLSREIAAKFSDRLKALEDKIEERVDVSKLLARLEAVVHLPDMEAVTQARQDCEAAQSRYPQLSGQLAQIGGALKLHESFLKASQAFYKDGATSKDVLTPIAAANGHPDQAAARELITKIDQTLKREPEIADEIKRAEKLLADSRADAFGKARMAYQLLDQRITALEREETSATRLPHLRELRQKAHDTWITEMERELAQLLKASAKNLRSGRTQELLEELQRLNPLGSVDLRDRAQAKLAARNAETLEENGEWEQAREKWREARDLNPDETERADYEGRYNRAWKEYATQLARAADYENGALGMQELARHLDNDPDVHRRVAEFYLEAAREQKLEPVLASQRLERAREAAQAGLRLGQRPKDLAAAGQLKKLKDLEKDIADEQTILRAGDELRSKTDPRRTVDDFAQAAEQVEELIQAHPRFAETWPLLRNERIQLLRTELQKIDAQRHWDRLTLYGKIFALDQTDGDAKAAILGIGPEVVALTSSLKRLATDHWGSDYGQEPEPFTAQLMTIRDEYHLGREAAVILQRFGQRVDHSATHLSALQQALTDAHQHMEALQKAQEIYRRALAAQVNLKKFGASESFDQAAADLDKRNFEQHVARDRLKTIKEAILEKRRKLEGLRQGLQLAAQAEDFSTALTLASELEAEDPADEYGCQAATIVVDPFPECLALGGRPPVQTGVKREIRTVRLLKMALNQKLEQFRILTVWQNVIEPVFNWPEARLQVQQLIEQRNWSEAHRWCEAAIKPVEIDEELYDLLDNHHSLVEALESLQKEPVAAEALLSCKAWKALQATRERRVELKAQSQDVQQLIGTIQITQDKYEKSLFPSFQAEWERLSDMHRDALRRTYYYSSLGRKVITEQRERVWLALQNCQKVCPRDPVLELQGYEHHPYLNS